MQVSNLRNESHNIPFSFRTKIIPKSSASILLLSSIVCVIDIGAGLLRLRLWLEQPVDFTVLGTLTVANTNGSLRAISIGPESINGDLPKEKGSLAHFVVQRQRSTYASELS